MANNKQMSSFQNKVVWITGASSGIGEALVYALAKQDAILILSSRRETELNKIMQNAGLKDANCLILPLDLADTANVETLVNKAIHKFSTIDILINNGGISQRANVKDTPLEIDRKLMEINYFGTIALTKAVLKHMLAQNSGHIVVVSSIAGKFGFYLRSAYSASKFALHGFFESLRMEVFKNNINVTIVCPGKIKTNISINAMNEKGEKNNIMDPSHANAMPAEECAKKILQAILKKKEEVYIGRWEIVSIYVKRFFPALFSRMIKNVKPT